MTSVRILSPAEREMVAAARYYESRSVNLGQRFLKEVQQTIEAIATHPYAGGVLRGDVRRRLLHRFPFAALYRLEPDEIVIVAVMDLRRDPDYWLGRL